MEAKNYSYRLTPEEAIEIAKSQGHVYPSINPPESAKPPAWAHNTKLSREELIDKIKGTIYGNAIGDAIGLSTEFLTGDAVKEFYKDKELSYANIIDDFHRSRWQKGDWTDDTDQMLLIMDSLLANAGHINTVDFAARLRFWVDHGYVELGDLAGLGLGLTVKRVVMHKKFTEDPHAASDEIFRASQGRAAANGAVMRTSILGIPNFSNLDQVIENTTQIAKVTHFDPRCVASCIAGTTAIAMMLQGQDCASKQNMKVICGKAIELARQVLKEHKEHDKEFTKLCEVKKIKELYLDDRDSIGYTFKCIASGIFAVKYAKDFKSAITELVMEAGDADTNGAIAGALVGCRFGYSKLPRDWLDGLVNKKWLDQRVEKFLKLLGLSE
jgi:ADP-ribosylglycohydrolase